MNRRNYTLHVALAGALVVLAAAAGRVERWEGRQGVAVKREAVAVAAPPVGEPPAAGADEAEDLADAEVLARFKPGASVERMKEIAASLNAEVEEEMESGEWLAAIDDTD